MIADFLQFRHHLMLKDHQLLEQVLRRDLFRMENTKYFQQLSAREVEVLALLGNGLNNPAIAKKLLISRSTVETHRKHLNRKLDIRSYNKLVNYALTFDLVEY